MGCDSSAETWISADRESDFDDLVIPANPRRKLEGGGTAFFTCIDLNLP